jgi:hypothetical protein
MQQQNFDITTPKQVRSPNLIAENILPNIYGNSSLITMTTLANQVVNNNKPITQFKLRRTSNMEAKSPNNKVNNMYFSPDISRINDQVNPDVLP